MADHDYVICSRLLLLVSKKAVQPKWHAQHLEEAFRNRGSGDTFGIANAGERLLVELRKGHALEDGVCGLPIAKVLLTNALQLAAPQVY